MDKQHKGTSPRNKPPVLSKAKLLKDRETYSNWNKTEEYIPKSVDKKTRAATVLPTNWNKKQEIGVEKSILAQANF